MSVVQELDKTLFEGYVNPKASIVMGIVRDGILDNEIDWYETPQPTGTFLNLLRIILIAQVGS
jgi:exocyst complex component 2